MKTITFDGWRSVPETFATRRQWLRKGRKTGPDAEPTARLIYTYEALPDAFSTDEIWLDAPDLRLLVGQSVPLYHVDQTVPTKQTPRTLACLEFEKVFLLHAVKDDYLRWNFTKPNTRNSAAGRPSRPPTTTSSTKRSSVATSTNGRSSASNPDHKPASWPWITTTMDGIGTCFWIRPRCCWIIFTAMGGTIRWPWTTSMGCTTSVSLRRRTIYRPCDGCYADNCGVWIRNTQTLLDGRRLLV